jgi:hypothetical protein
MLIVSVLLFCTVVVPTLLLYRSTSINQTLICWDYTKGVDTDTPDKVVFQNTGRAIRYNSASGVFIVGGNYYKPLNGEMCSIIK